MICITLIQIVLTKGTAIKSSSRKNKQTMYKIANFISGLIGIRGDYVLHFMVGLAFGLPYLILPLLHTVLIASVFFIGKEIWDKYKPAPTGFDWLDLIADYLGLTISILTIWLIF